MSLSTWSTQAQHEHWLQVQTPHPPTNLLLLRGNQREENDAIKGEEVGY